MEKRRHWVTLNGLLAIALAGVLWDGAAPRFGNAQPAIAIRAGSNQSPVTDQSNVAWAAAPVTMGSGGSGGQLYAANCAACHGATGEGGIGPSLRTSAFSQGATVSAVANGVGSMPGFAGSLTTEQIDAVSSFSFGLQSGTATTTTVVPEDTSGAAIGQGAEIYAANCAACHGASGEGGIGPSLKASVFNLAATVDAITDGLGTMPGFSSGLSAEQIDAVGAFSVTFQSGGAPGSDDSSLTRGPPTGEGADLYAANCAACHGTQGEGGVAAPVNVPFANDQLVEIIRVGIGEMPGFAAGLTDGQITVLAEFVNALAAQSAPTTTIPPSGAEHFAIQPSRYVEFDTDDTSLPLAAEVQLGLALGTMALLALLAYWELRRVRRAGAPSADGDVD